MGVTLRCKKTHHSHDLGVGGFLRLRTKVAQLYSEEFGKHYSTLAVGVPYSLGNPEAREEWYKEHDRKTEEMIADGRLDIKIADFCYQSDISGRIRYGACKNILKAIGDYDDNILYGYCGRPDCMKFKDFKNLLQECVDNKCDLVWD